MYGTEGFKKWNSKEDRRWQEEQEKWRNDARLREEDRARRHRKEEIRMLKEQERLDEIKRFEEDIRREREEEERQKAKKKKKKKKPELRDEYLDDPRARRHDKRMPEKHVTHAQAVDTEADASGVNLSPKSNNIQSPNSSKNSEVLCHHFKFGQLIFLCEYQVKYVKWS